MSITLSISSFEYLSSLTEPLNLYQVPTFISFVSLFTSSLSCTNIFACILSVLSVIFKVIILSSDLVSITSTLNTSASNVTRGVLPVIVSILVFSSSIILPNITLGSSTVSIFFGV